ncbi:MAG TPA: thioesterase family protein [Polyangiaceae bacterium]|nr:thioesterase family protein [Polyangiaceae bacterium]
MAERRPYVMGRHDLHPARSKSHVEIRVRFGETDLMGIVHHASYLSYFEAARVAWLRRRGVTYKTWAERGWHLPVVEAQLRYRAPAKFEDVLTVEVELSDIRSHSLRFTYKVTRDSMLLAEGETRLACVDGKHELLKLPGPLVEVLLRAESHTPHDAVC